jgi:hypothetical protein
VDGQPHDEQRDRHRHRHRRGHRGVRRLGESPDILDFSPDGALAFITLRGPNPRSGGSAVHPIAGGTPGVAVVDVATRQVVEVLRPNDDVVDPALEGDGRLSDFHGIGVRRLGLPSEVTRLAGAGRIQTAIAISQAAFDDGEATGAVIARADDYPDALAGTSLAARAGGPVLLSATDGLPAEVAAELQRILPAEAEVHLLGGEAALAPAVVTAVEALGFTTVRVAGPSRYETAVAVAETLDDPVLLLLTTGLDAPDAVAAGAAAAAAGGAVLLTAGDAPHPATLAYLDGAGDGEHVAVGGPASRAHPDADPIVGPTRVETAIAVAEAFSAEAEVLGLARSDDFADALTGGAHVGPLGGAVLLTPTAALHPAVSTFVCDRSETLRRGFAYGGTAALSASTVEALANRLDGEGCGEPLTLTTASARAATAHRSDGLVCALPTT